MDARAGLAPTPFSSIDEIYLSYSERESEGASLRKEDPRGDELLEAIRRGGGGRRIWGAPERRARYLAQEANGRLPALVRLAAAPSGPTQALAILEELEGVFRGAVIEHEHAVRSEAPAIERARRDLEAAERAGDEESAAALRQALASMGA